MLTLAFRGHVEESGEVLPVSRDKSPKTSFSHRDALIVLTGYSRKNKY